MLVLSRDRDTAIRIGTDVKVKVLSIRKQRVKLGIEAPQDVRVWRDEMAPEPDSATSGQPDAIETDLLAGAGKTDPCRNGHFPILMVEDDPDHARLISKVLSDCQVHQITHAATGTDAIDSLSADLASNGGVIQPHLVLLDLHLPDMPGLAVLRQIRAIPRFQTLPVVILSGEQHETMVADCLQAGANAFVNKSGEFREFRESVSRIVTFWKHHCRTARSAGALSV
ncbi:MAG TPA: response regulator [Thermoguttaceae bacterium]|nr:response regulator [Thermoguttaceae bacterium]